VVLLNAPPYAFNQNEGGEIRKKRRKTLKDIDASATPNPNILG
jgi:hypothetical protein